MVLCRLIWLHPKTQRLVPVKEHYRQLRNFRVAVTRPKLLRTGLNRPAYYDVRGDIGCRTNARVDAVRPLNRHDLNSRTARDSGLPVVPLVFNTMYDVALPGLGGEKRVYAAGWRL